MYQLRPTVREKTLPKGVILNQRIHLCGSKIMEVSGVLSISKKLGGLGRTVLARPKGWHCAAGCGTVQGSPGQVWSRFPTSQWLLGLPDSSTALACGWAHHRLVLLVMQSTSMCHCTNYLLWKEKKKENCSHWHQACLRWAAFISDQAVQSFLLKSLVSVAVVWKVNSTLMVYCVT